MRFIYNLEWSTLGLQRLGGKMEGLSLLSHDTDAFIPEAVKDFKSRWKHSIGDILSVDCAHEVSEAGETHITLNRGLHNLSQVGLCIVIIEVQ